VNIINEELKTILSKFTDSGWDLTDVPAKEYLCGVDNKIILINAIKQADEQCCSCGCEFDLNYKSA
jgi:hypothetical protein